ncbi:MAG TPA: hypothetical protein VGF77_06185 [Allosphingosinicella sp.]|jgi:hypothetical protein
MSPLERRARLMLWGMCPAYLVYFVLQIVAPTWLTTLPARLACLAAAAGVHVTVFAIGSLVFGRKDRGPGLTADERDLAIEGHATRIAYSVLLIGMVFVGMIMPFNQGGWQIVNGALLVIVLAETTRNLLVARGYRGGPRLAH